MAHCLMCTQGAAWAWYLSWEDMYTIQELGMVPCFGEICTQSAARAWYLAWEDVYTRRG